jgi:hypothetical protein
MPKVQNKSKKGKHPLRKRSNDESSRRSALRWPIEVFVLGPSDIKSNIVMADPEDAQSIWGHMNNQFKFALEVPHTHLNRIMDLWVGSMARIQSKMQDPKAGGRLTYIRHSNQMQKALLYNMTWIDLGYTENNCEEALKIYNLAFKDQHR